MLQELELPQCSGLGKKDLEKYRWSEIVLLKTFLKKESLYRYLLLITKISKFIINSLVTVHTRLILSTLMSFQFEWRNPVCFPSPRTVFILNWHNDCKFSYHFTSCCFCQEHYSRLEEKFWNCEIGNRKFDSLSSTRSSRGWTCRLNWFNPSGWPIHLPGGIRHCAFVSWFTAFIWPLCP